MKQLGTVVLYDEAVWSDQDDWSQVRQEATRTLSGTLVVEAAVRQNGRPITIEINDGISWMSEADRDAIQAMALQVGATFTLTWESETFTVMFRHEDAPAVSFRPIVPNYDLFIGTIKLTQV